MKKYLLFLLLIVLLLAACTSQSSALTGEWKLIAYGPLESMNTSVNDTNASLTFAEDGTVSGNGGCNSLGGEYTVEGKTITFGQLTSTLMACDESLMNQETIVMQVLNGTAEFEIEDQTLAITNNGMVLVFSQIPTE